MITVTLYHLEGQPASQQTLMDLKSLAEQFPFQLIVIDIHQNKFLQEKMSTSAPVVEVGPYLRAFPFSKLDLQVMIQSAIQRSDQIDTINHKTDQKDEKPISITGGDKLTIWLSQHFMLLFNFVVLVYVGVPFLAPFFLKVNMEVPARIIYTIYSPMCHQLAFRSWFLFGEQLFYPREAAHLGGFLSYEQAINPDSRDLNFARRYWGDSQIGYKVALCQRDVAMYGSFLFFGIVFVASGRKFKPLPWFLWIFLSLVPIGVDGLSQLPGLADGLPGWLPQRESTPYLRLVTGFSFGFFTGWYLFPLVEQTMQETRILMQRKAAKVLHQNKRD